MLPPFTAWSPSPASPSSASGPASDAEHQPPMATPSQERTDQPKKPRHRHSAFQLAALNELYDKNEHPSLEERTSLAERLGMETKTVNSWFQNKRASSKKRHKGSSTAPGTNNSAGSDLSTRTKSSSSVELPPISALIASVAAPPGLVPPHMASHDFDDYSDEEQLVHLSHTQRQSLFYAGNAQHRHLFEAEQNQPRKGRSRPTAMQTEALKKLYEMNPHPSKEEREALGRRIDMRYQSVTNWFQNQRSIAKKRKEEDDAHAAAVAAAHAHPGSSSKSRMFSPFPPAASAAHPSLATVPPATGHPSLAFPIQHASVSAPVPRARRSSSAAPLSRGRSYAQSHSHLSDSRPASPRVSPYRTASDRSHASSHGGARPRRTRPEPHQLVALKKLFRRTATPSIEERGALALEIGMDVGKVTNWFRNLRQTARKRARARRGPNPDGEVDELEEGELDCEEHDVDMDVDADDISLATYNMHSRSVSRAGTPVQSTASSTSSPLIQSTHMHMIPPPPYSLEDPAAFFFARELRAYSPPPVKHHSFSRGRSTYAQAPSSAVRPSAHPHAHAPPQVYPPSHMHSDADAYAYADGDSHMGSEEEYQEAVTPSPVASPPPRVSVAELLTEKTADTKRAVVGQKFETGVKVEDALLLLSFYHHVVR